MGTVKSRSRINFGSQKRPEASRPVAINWVEEAAASDSSVKKNLAYYFKAYFSNANVSLKDNLNCSAAVRETLFNHAAYVKSAMKVKSMANTTDDVCEELEDDPCMENLEAAQNHKTESIQKLDRAG